MSARRGSKSDDGDSTRDEHARVMRSKRLDLLLSGSLIVIGLVAAAWADMRGRVSQTERAASLTYSAPEQPLTAAWAPRGVIDEAMLRQLRKPWLSPGERARLLASGQLRVTTAEFASVLRAARRDESEVGAGLRPPFRRSLLCGAAVCAPLFASADDFGALRW